MDKAMLMDKRAAKVKNYSKPVLINLGSALTIVRGGTGPNYDGNECKYSGV